MKLATARATTLQKDARAKTAVKMKVRKSKHTCQRCGKPCSCGADVAENCYLCSRKQCVAQAGLEEAE